MRGHHPYRRHAERGRGTWSTAPRARLEIRPTAARPSAWDVRAVADHEYCPAVGGIDLAHRVEAGLLIAPDGAPVPRRRVGLYAGDGGIGEQALHESSDHRGAETT